MSQITAAELLRFPLFEGENPEALAWIAEHMQVRELDTGDVFLNPGVEVTDFQLVLDGELHIERLKDTYGGLFVRTPGQVMGLLPFSRMKSIPARGWAVQPSRIATLDRSYLRELVYRAPLVAERLVAEMTDRTRAVTRSEEGSNRLLALGKLSAGLAHELNNPAAAAVRSSARLREVLLERRRYAMALRDENIPAKAREIVATITEAISHCTTASPGQVDALERADREGEIGDWLEERGVPGQLASGLVDAGLGIDRLAPFAELVSREALELGLRVTIADHEVFCLTEEVEEAVRRISDLVQAVKTYSYMDRSPTTEVDLEQGLDVTLRMFQHQLKHGFTVNRQFTKDLPRVRANGSALNQVWTNLIDNAIDAMQSLPPGEFRVLGVRTCLEPGCALVEIADNGPGIPPEVKSRMFEPFFTTKPVGEGTGLGLDIVHRIVRNHNGSITVDSEPGRTVFQVRLPI